MFFKRLKRKRRKKTQKNASGPFPDRRNSGGTPVSARAKLHHYRLFAPFRSEAQLRRRASGGGSAVSRVSKKHRKIPEPLKPRSPGFSFVSLCASNCRVMLDNTWTLFLFCCRRIPYSKQHLKWSRILDFVRNSDFEHIVMMSILYFTLFRFENNVFGSR